MIAREKGIGKLTLTLSIEGKREDGFHDLRAFTVFLKDVFDVVELQYPRGISPSLEIEMIDLRSDPLKIDENNLVLKAVEQVHQVISDSIDIHEFFARVTKMIPVQAGLGGGSVDAAATLRLLENIYPNILQQDDLYRIGDKLGSDVCACLYSSSCWMTEKGQTIMPVDVDLSSTRVFVVTPYLYCSTPAVYKQYDQMGCPKDDGSNAPDCVSHIIDNIHNDLSLAAYELYPALFEIKEKLQRITGTKFFLAGSGSTLFSIGDKDFIKEVSKMVDPQEYRLCKVSSLQ